MKTIRIGLVLCALFNLTACAQINKKHQHSKVMTKEINKITNPIVRGAIEAWQQGDSQKWLSFFVDDAQLLDDGKKRDFKKFSTEAIGTERFTSIDKVEDSGLSIYGEFHSDTWGDFKTYFKFYQDASGKFQKLEIGQAKY